MTEANQKVSRKDQILQCLASMLEANPGARITTASLAKQVGVSEAALYRHFPSKAKMFEGLIEFIEDSVFSKINPVLSENQQPQVRCQKVILLLLTFAEENPGICRIMTGDALAGETERLRERVAQFFDRIDDQLKQILSGESLRSSEDASSTLILAFTEGRIRQYVRSEFAKKPTEHWESLSDSLVKAVWN